MNKILDLYKTITKAKVNIKDIIYIFQYGSRVYGSNNEKSDWDFIVIINSSVKETQFISDDINITFYNKERFIELRDEHDISVLEFLYLPIENKWLITQVQDDFNIYDFKINLTKLRNSISHISSNSWVKAKKKLIVENDRNLDVGLKSLFHSLRILNYGAQLAKNGKIINYAICNMYKENIFNYAEHYLNINNNNYEQLWLELEKKYKPIYNELATNFRKLAPKQIK
jgi:predicted nucleotidyltransferase